MKKTVLIVIALIFAMLIVISLRPIDTSEANSSKVTGIVKSVSKGGANDLVFELEGDKTTYYINRGLENGYDLKNAKSNYLGKKATINYSNQWTILAPFGTKSKHIFEITIDSLIIYSEWKT